MNLRIQNLLHPQTSSVKAGHEVITIEKQAGKTVKGKKGEASVAIDKSIDEVTPQSSMPCCYRAVIHQIICVVITVLSPSHAIL